MKTIKIFMIAVISICLVVTMEYTVWAEYECRGIPCTIWDDSLTNVLHGTSGDDVICGRFGDDLIYGGGGDDLICGDEGNDTIYGGSGDDEIMAGSGNDIIYGEEGDDFILGNSGNDTAHGGPGKDLITGWTGNDTLWGNEGEDRLIGQQDDDKLFGGPGNDSLDGAGGNDVLYGGDDNDIITGGQGNDFLYGQDGNDQLMSHEGNDALFGGNGLDILLGMEGDDKLYGEGGNDHLDGGTGTDYCYDDTGTNKITNCIQKEHLPSIPPPCDSAVKSPTINSPDVGQVFEIGKIHLFFEIDCRFGEEERNDFLVQIQQGEPPSPEQQPISSGRFVYDSFKDVKYFTNPMAISMEAAAYEHDIRSVGTATLNVPVKGYYRLRVKNSINSDPIGDWSRWRYFWVGRDVFENWMKGMLPKEMVKRESKIDKEAAMKQRKGELPIENMPMSTKETDQGSAPHLVEKKTPAEMQPRSGETVLDDKLPLAVHEYEIIRPRRGKTYAERLPIKLQFLKNIWLALTIHRGLEPRQVSTGEMVRNYDPNPIVPVWTVYKEESPNADNAEVVYDEYKKTQSLPWGHFRLAITFHYRGGVKGSRVIYIPFQITPPKKLAAKSAQAPPIIPRVAVMGAKSQFRPGDKVTFAAKQDSGKMPVVEVFDGRRWVAQPSRSVDLHKMGAGPQTRYILRPAAPGKYRLRLGSVYSDPVEVEKAMGAKTAVQAGPSEAPAAGVVKKSAVPLTPKGTPKLNLSKKTYTGQAKVKLKVTADIAFRVEYVLEKKISGKFEAVEESNKPEFRVSAPGNYQVRARYVNGNFSAPVAFTVIPKQAMTPAPAPSETTPPPPNIPKNKALMKKSQ